MDKEQIKQLRLNLGMSQQAFATRLGISITTVNRWETGDFKPSHFAEEKLQKLHGKYERKTKSN
jgi:DNA-binding transcriptional regulator YiaG